MKSIYESADIPQIPGAEVGILQAEWYSEYSDSMVGHCTSLLKEAHAGHIHHHILPGTLELPLAARQLVRNNPKIEAIILFGIILRGETLHFDMILDIVARGIERVMFEEDIPLINEILPATSIAQVEARTGDNTSNKGREAAIASAKVISWRRQFGIRAKVS